MKINVKTKIKYKDQEYSSVEELPPEVRAAYEKVMATGGASVSTKIVFNGQEYASLELMPAPERQLYEDALKLTHDTGAVAPVRKAGTAALLTPHGGVGGWMARFGLGIVIGAILRRQTGFRLTPRKLQWNLPATQPTAQERLFTKRQRQLVLLFAVLVMIAVIIFLLKR